MSVASPPSPAGFACLRGYLSVTLLDLVEIRRAGSPRAKPSLPQNMDSCKEPRSSCGELPPSQVRLAAHLSTSEATHPLDAVPQAPTSAWAEPSKPLQRTLLRPLPVTLYQAPRQDGRSDELPQ